MPNRQNMPKYQGTKELYAKPMTLGDYNKLQGWTIPKDQDPFAEGYLVEYIGGGEPNHQDFDGYISWSPKEVFEAAYKLIETPLDRVAIELNELNARAAGLGKYIASGKHVDLGKLQAGLLGAQFDLMDSYSKVLTVRSVFMGGGVEVCNYGDYDSFALLTKVDWPTAQRLVMEGFTIVREGWNGKGMFVTYSEGQEALPADRFWIPANKRAAEKNGGSMDVSPYFSLKTAQNTIQMGWVPSIGDLTATDWVVLA